MKRRKIIKYLEGDMVVHGVQVLSIRQPTVVTFPGLQQVNPYPIVEQPGPIGIQNLGSLNQHEPQNLHVEIYGLFHGPAQPGNVVEGHGRKLVVLVFFAIDDHVMFRLLHEGAGSVAWGDFGGFKRDGCGGEQMELGGSDAW